jgi:hypothetical protein
MGGYRFAFYTLVVLAAVTGHVLLREIIVPAIARVPELHGK